MIGSALHVKYKLSLSHFFNRNVHKSKKGGEIRKKGKQYSLTYIVKSIIIQTKIL